MDNALLALNILVCAFLACLCAAAVLSPRVKDGVVVKAGLILAALGFAGVGATLFSESPPIAVVRALGLLHVGLTVTICGWAWRKRRHRRLSDWMDLAAPSRHDHRATG